MATKDNRKFKTPFYKIFVGDSLGQNLIELPHSLIRLVEKVEILDSFETISKITITFVEGSREPASPASDIGSKKLYKTTGPGDRSDIDLSLSNRTGLLTDLRFSGSGGITFTKAPIAAPISSNTGSAAVTGAIAGTGDITISVNPTVAKAPNYLFQERNQLKVTWGYLEDPSTVRSMRCQIIMTETEFPDVGQPRTTVTAQSTLAFLDQLALNKSVNFGKAFRTGKGNEVIDFADTETETMLRDICSKAGIPCIISENLPANLLDRGHFKMWIAGESFREFLHRLADMHNCYYNVITDSATGIDTLVFAKKSDLESKPVISDQTLFNYKQPGSILKSFNIRADFGMIGGNTEVSIDNSGNVIQQVYQNAQEQTVLFNTSSDSKSGGEQLQVLPDFNPTGNNPNFASAGIAKAFANQAPNSTSASPQYVISGKLENSPIDSVSHLSDRSQSKAVNLARAITIDFVSLGYTRLLPGVVQIGNIGTRYSGKYRVLTVNHTIDSNGYICRATGTTYALAQGGTIVPSLVGQETPQTESVQLFQPTSGNGTPSIRDSVTALQTKQ